MKIQVITTEIEKYNDEMIESNPFDKPESLDCYDINVIDLNNENVWYNDERNINDIYIGIDLIHIGKMIQNSKKTKFVFLLPQNYTYYYDHDEDINGIMGYQSSEPLKNILNFIEDYIVNEFFSYGISLEFEPNKTKINNEEITSDFYFPYDHNGLTRSIGSDKATTIYDTYCFTTLDLRDGNQLMNLLSMVKLTSEKSNIPEWFDDINFNDDITIKDSIENNVIEIRKLEQQILESNIKLEQNNRYKSILYSNSDELVEVVFEMLAEMLEYDFTDFVDEKKEDFLIKLDNLVMVGEIKGVGKNVKAENLSQLEKHFQDYLEVVSESEKKDDRKVIQVLIINHQRNQKPEERQPIHANQLKLADRYGTSIIETTTLLKIYEMFKNDKIAKEEVVKLISENTGKLCI